MSGLMNVRGYFARKILLTSVSKTLVEIDFAIDCKIIYYDFEC